MKKQPRVLEILLWLSPLMIAVVAFARWVEVVS